MRSVLFLTTGLVASALLLGCNTTQQDVTAARDRVAKERRDLEDAKRDANRTVHKPIVEDSARQREIDRAQQRVAKEQDDVRDAQRDAAETEKDLANEQHRDQFLIDCKASIDLANRAIEKLQTKRNAATEDQKADIDRHINDMKSKRDALQTEINNIRTANKDRWMDHKAGAQRAMEDLNRESGKVS